MIEKLEAHDDMNPAHIIRECLTDPDWGMGYQDADIDDVSFMNAADTLFDEKMGMSLLWSRQDTIEEFVQEVTKHIDAALYVDRRTGLFTLKLVRDDYEEASLPVFDESNISKIQNLQKASFGELVNSVTVNYWDAATGKTASLTVQDTALVQMQNAVINTTIQYPGFTSPEVASIAAMRDLKALSSPLWSGTIYCGQDAEDLNIGDVFKLSWSDYEIENVVMRITGLAFGNGKSKTVKVICTQDVYATPNESTIKAPDIEDGWQPLDNTPTPLNSTLIQEIPYYELVTRLGQTEIDEKLAEDANLSYMIASGSRPNSEGALNALLFVNSGSAYEEQDTLDFSPSAKIANDVLPTQTTFVIENGVDLDVVSIGTFCQLGEELLRVDEISETTLTVGRGILDTVPTPHLAGSEILFLDEFLASDEIEYTASESIDVKLLTVTGGGVLDIEDAVEDSLTFDSRPIRPYPPGNFKINTVPFGNVIDNLNDLTIAWSHRDRTLQTSGEFEDQTTGNIGPEVGTTYNLRIYGEADTLGREETLISGTSYLYELATEKTDFLIPNESAGSGPATSVDITDLKAFWTFDESTGTDVLDVHTTAINGTLTSTALRDSEGFMNTCLKADSSNYVSLGSASNLLGLVDTFEYVAAVWIPSAGDSFYMLDLGYRGFSSDGQCEGLLFYVNSGNLAFRVKTADADFGNALRGRWDTGLALKPGEWNLVFCSRTPTEASGHVFNSDGNFSATLDLGGTFGLVWADFGNWMLGIANGSGSPNAGTTPGAKLDYQGVFARTLSAAERVSMWNGGNGFLYPFEASGGEYRANGRLRIELESERDGFKSFNKYSHEILREGYGFNYGKLYGGV